MLLLDAVAPVEVVVDHLGRSAIAFPPGFPVVLATLVPVGEETRDVVARFPTIGRVAEHALTALHWIVPVWNLQGSGEPDLHLVVVLGHTADQTRERAWPVVRNGDHISGRPTLTFGQLHELVGFAPTMEPGVGRTQSFFDDLALLEFLAEPVSTGPGFPRPDIRRGATTIRTVEGQVARIPETDEFDRDAKQVAGRDHPSG